MRRRDLLAMLAATAAAAPAGAVAAQAVSTPLAKAFPFLEAYLGLPSAARSRFHLAYRAMRGRAPAADPFAVIVTPSGGRIPVAFDREGVVLRLPGLAELESGARFETAGPTLKLAPELRADVVPASRLDAAPIEAALAQANAAVARVAGALAFAAPKLTAAYFPGAGDGEALMANGRASPLPVAPVPSLGPVAYFEPANFEGARALALARAPSRILLGGAPKRA